jgi:hypothetical protein
MREIFKLRPRRFPVSESKEDMMVVDNSMSSKTHMHPDQAGAMRNPTTYPEMSSYGHYRALMYVASCPNKPAISKDSFSQDHPFSAGFSKEDQDMINMAAKLCGYAPRTLGTGYSTEPETVHKLSPVNHNSGKNA